MLWVAIAMIILGAPFYARYVLTGRRGAIRWLLFLIGAAPIVALPMLLPLDATLDWPVPLLKLVASIAALVGVMHLADFAWVRTPDPKMRTDFPHFYIGFMSAADAYWVEPSERGPVRMKGLRILGRGLAKLPFALGLLALSTAYPTLHDHWLLQTFWVLWLAYFLMTAGADFLAVAPWYLAGIRVDEMFNAPPLAHSPRDFWSRRWNLIFRTLAHRNIFLPLGGRRRPLLGVSAVFLFSALVHEYIVVMALGTTQGHMAAFFLLHGVATIAYGFLSRQREGRPFMPRPAGIALHLAFFTVTSWLFFQPFLQIVPVDTIRLW